MYKIYLFFIVLISNCLTSAAQLQFANFSTQNVSCPSAQDGRFDWKIIGGVAPYSVSPFGISTILPTMFSSNLLPGTYTIVVADANNVSTSTIATIGISVTTTKILATKNLICAGDSVLLSPLFNQNGATVATNYCLPGFSSFTNEDITNFSFGSINNATSCNNVGNFTSVINKYNNYANISTTVQANDVIPFSFVVSNCNGGAGSSNISSIFIDYNIDGDFNGPNEQVYVSAANYTGAHTESGVIAIPANIEKGITRLRIINATATAATINSCGNYIHGEAEDYTIFLQQAPTSIYWTSNTVSSLDTVLTIMPNISDTVKLEINYGNGCIDTAVTPILLYPTPTVNINPINATCANAALLAVVYTGVSPITYKWLPTLENTASITNLNTGVYSVLITDSNNCKASASYSVTISPLITASPQVTNVKCFGEANGAINVNVTGGVAPYTYSWAPTYPNTPIINGLIGSTYSVSITDANNCSYSTTIVVTQPTAPLQVQMNSVNASGFGVNDGQANAVATGGTPAYSYLWSPAGQTTPLITGLAGGVYTVQVVDAKGCTTNGTVIVDQANAISDLEKKYGLQVYPNPTADYIVIDSKIQIKNVELIASNGQIVFTKQYNQLGIITINCAAFANGIYSLRCNTEITKTIVIKH
jgi:large repetitive protein